MISDEEDKDEDQEGVRELKKYFGSEAGTEKVLKIRLITQIIQEYQAKKDLISQKLQSYNYYSPQSPPTELELNYLQFIGTVT